MKKICELANLLRRRPRYLYCIDLVIWMDGRPLRGARRKSIWAFEGSKAVFSSNFEGSLGSASWRVIESFAKRYLIELFGVFMSRTDVLGS